MSKWDFVKQFVLDEGYTPKNITMDEYIANIILHYEGDLEAEGIEEESSWPLGSWLETLGSMEVFDYK